MKKTIYTKIVKINNRWYVIKLFVEGNLCLAVSLHDKFAIKFEQALEYKSEFENISQIVRYVKEYGDLELQDLIFKIADEDEENNTNHELYSENKLFNMALGISFVGDNFKALILQKQNNN